MLIKFIQRELGVALISSNSDENCVQYRFGMLFFVPPAYSAVAPAYCVSFRELLCIANVVSTTLTPWVGPQKIL